MRFGRNKQQKMAIKFLVHLLNPIAYVLSGIDPHQSSKASQEGGE